MIELKEQSLLQKDDKVVSYTQFSLYMNCPKSWELAYARKLRSGEPNIHLLFGTAMHNVIQRWLTVMFSETVKKANEIDFRTELFTGMVLQHDKLKAKWGRNFTTPEALAEFYDDGVQILEWLKKKRVLYFNTKKLKLVGVEVPLVLSPVPSKPMVKLMSYLDLVLYDVNMDLYEVIDIKTSTRGWYDYQKRDQIKTSQLALYKIYFSEVYNIPIDKIQVKFFIVKRKLQENSIYTQRRVQEFEPASGTVTRNRVIKQFVGFVKNSFDDTGQPRLDIEYPAIEGEGGKRCRFCEFKDDLRNCPKNRRVENI